MHLSARESVEALDARTAAGVRVTAEVTPHHLCLTDEAVRSLDAEREDEPAAARPRRTGRRCSTRSATARSPRSRPTTRRTRATRRTCRSRRRRSASPASRRRSPSLYTHLVEPGVLPLELAARAHVGRPGAGPRPAGAADRGRGAGEPRPARPRGASGGWSESGFRSRSVNSWLLGETLRGRGAR